MNKVQLSIETENKDGACWTCLKRNRICDMALPHCRNCEAMGIRCRGYGTQMRLPSDIMASTRRTSMSQHNRPHRRSEGRLPSADLTQTHQQRTRRFSMPQGISSLALPPEDSFFMQHFLQNLARIALAIDYTENGYRMLMPMAMQEPALLNAMLAIAASHHSRWQQTSDTASRGYLRLAAKALRDRFSEPDLLRSQVTLAGMLLMVSFEVFAGTARWKGHVDAIQGWIRSRGGCADLDPFLKDWVCLIETQNALNMGLPAMPEVKEWMDTAAGESCMGGDQIDALFGCSARLPCLMWTASQLYNASNEPGSSWADIQQRAEALQAEIRATRIDTESVPSLGILCQSPGHTFSAIVGMEDEELRRRMVATAEIFRHALHIYVFRISNDPGAPLTEEMQASLRSAMQLLTSVPDALGPGANLGWCLVVIGAELDDVNDREYLRSRWAGLHLLGISNSKNGQRILEECWSNRDLSRHALAAPERWQDVMQRIGETQILV